MHIGPPNRWWSAGDVGDAEFGMVDTSDYSFDGDLQISCVVCVVLNCISEVIKCMLIFTTDL